MVDARQDILCSPVGVSFTLLVLTPVTRYGKVVIHKAKRNTNMSFSKGKTWSLEDVQQIEVFGVSARLDHLDAHSRSPKTLL